MTSRSTRTARTAPSTGSASRRPAVPVDAVVPVLAVAALAVTVGRELPVAVQVVLVALLAGSVLAAVHHAEVVAHRVGEPFGSLILAVAVTVIEVGLIVSLMISGGEKTTTLARDTVFAAVMITCNGIVGLSLLIGSLRRRVAVFNPDGIGATLATVVTLATVTLVLPTFTTSAPGPEFAPPQLAFAAAISLALYALFVFVQNVGYRDYFLPAPRDDGAGGGRGSAADLVPDPEDRHAAPPPTRRAVRSLVLLVAALVGVVGLAKVESPAIEAGVAWAGLPPTFVGVLIALLVLLPETLAAARNAHRDRVQTSLNLALGSAMASIGLTIPAIALATVWLDPPLVLGLGPTQVVLLALTAVVGVLTLVAGRAGPLRAGVHLAVCASFLFLAASP